MPENSESSGFDRLTRYVSGLSAYAVLVASLYLWGYWSFFEINILEYLALSDVVNAAAPTLVILAAGLGLGALISEVIFGPRLPPGGGKDARFVKWMGAHRKALGICFATAVGFLLFAPEFQGKWLALSLFLAPVLALEAKRRGMFMDVLPDDGLRSVAPFVLAVMPGYAYEQGRSKALYVVDGRAFDFVLSPTEAAAPSLVAPSPQQLRYLGHAGEIVFLWNAQNRAVTLTKLDSKAPIIVGHWDHSRAAGGSLSAAGRPSASAAPLPPKVQSAARP